MVLVPRRRRRLARGTALAVLSAWVLGCGGGEDVPPAAAPPDARSTAATADATVEIPVNWLVAHQSADGGWEAAACHRWRTGERVEEGECPGPGTPHNDVAVTALATLRHLLAGYRPCDEGPFGAAVAWGLHALRERQRPDGCVSDPSQRLWATNNALAAWALAEAACVGAGEETVGAARRALTFLSSSLAAGAPAWRTERGPGDLPPLAWATRAYAAARDADRASREATPRRLALLEEEGALEAARAEVAGWAAAAVAERTVGRVGASLLARAATDPAWGDGGDARAALAWLDEHVPVWDPGGAGVDFAGWYLATAARCAAGGEGWEAWQTAVRAAVVDHQRKDGDYCRVKGSWDPVGVWGAEGGRVFSTAACGLICLVYFRCDLHGRGFHVARPAGEPLAVPPPPPPADPLPRRVHRPCR